MHGVSEKFYSVWKRRNLNHLQVLGDMILRSGMITKHCPGQQCRDPVSCLLFFGMLVDEYRRWSGKFHRLFPHSCIFPLAADNYIRNSSYIPGHKWQTTMMSTRLHAQWYSPSQSSHRGNGRGSGGSIVGHGGPYRQDNTWQMTPSSSESSFNTTSSRFAPYHRSLSRLPKQQSSQIVFGVHTSANLPAYQVLVDHHRLQVQVCAIPLVCSFCQLNIKLGPSGAA